MAKKDISLLKNTTNGAPGKRSEGDIANEIYSIAKETAEIEIAKMRDEMNAVRTESHALGILQKIKYDNANNELLKHLILYQLKKNKEYLKGGMTWEEFCKSIGEPRRTLEEKLKDISPFVDNLTASFAAFSEVPFNKIRYLGRSIAAESAGFDGNCLIIEDVKIALKPENKDDIEALIDNLKETQKKKLEEQNAKIRAKDRMLDEKERVILRQEKNLAKFEREVKARGFEPGEESFIKKMENLKLTLTGIALQLETRIMPDDCTPLMIAAYIETLGHATRTFKAYYDTATTRFGDPDIDDDWIPPHLRPDYQEPGAGE